MGSEDKGCGCALQVTQSTGLLRGHFAAGDIFLPLDDIKCPLCKTPGDLNSLGYYLLLLSSSCLFRCWRFYVFFFFLLFSPFFFKSIYFVPFILTAEYAGCILHFQVSLVCFFMAFTDQAAGFPAPTNSQYTILLSHILFFQERINKQFPFKSLFAISPLNCFNAELLHFFSHIIAHYCIANSTVVLKDILIFRRGN